MKWQVFQQTRRETAQFSLWPATASGKASDWARSHFKAADARAVRIEALNSAKLLEARHRQAPPPMDRRASRIAFSTSWPTRTDPPPRKSASWGRSLPATSPRPDGREASEKGNLGTGREGAWSDFFGKRAAFAGNHPGRCRRLQALSDRQETGADDGPQAAAIRQDDHPRAAVRARRLSVRTRSWKWASRQPCPGRPRFITPRRDAAKLIEACPGSGLAH